MKNINEIVLTIRDLKMEFAEACEKSVGLTGKALERNENYRNKLVNEMLRLESIAREEVERQGKERVNISKVNIEFEIAEEDTAIKQDSIVSSFRKTMKKVYNEQLNTSNKEISERQRETILSGLRDRIGIDVDQQVMAFVNKFNYNQANELIKILRGVSFFGERLLVTNAVKTLSHREDYEEILQEVTKNIHKKAWMDANKDLINIANELQAPTEPQIRKIANVAKYPETAEALKEFGIDVRDYEVRALSPSGDVQPFYTMNWNLLRKDIEDRMNRESASNFIQTYDYITNYYEGRNLESHERNHLRSLYIQLGDYECTRPSYLNTILKDQYDYVSSKLEEAVRLEKVLRNTEKSRFREAMLTDKTRVKREARETRSVVLKTEQEQARDFTSFVFNIYAVIGQETPEEATRILPYFVEGGEIKYATVEEVHYQEFRKLVFEQREVIKQVNPSFNWGAFLCNQPTHILKALGLDMMM